MSNFAAYDKIHNQSIEINQLRAELERAKKAYARLQVSRNVERKSHQEKLAAAHKRTSFYKGKFMLLSFGRREETNA